MGNALTLVIGVVVTIVVSRYYFRRAVNKSLGVYGLLNSSVFEGIAQDVRKDLHFHFQQREVRELQQLVFLVANDGEKGIRDVIEPLLLQIPADVEVLDASIIHRWPDSLKVELRSDPTGNSGSNVAFHFLLLNKREFFVVKLLLSGRLSLSDMSFSILAEDLPRVVTVKAVPQTAIRDAGYRFDWAMGTIATVSLAWLVWWSYWLLMLRGVRPDLFPYPWTSFKVSGKSLLLLIPGAISLVLISLMILALFSAASFGGAVGWPRGPRFPLPKELREAVFPYPLTADGGLKPTGWEDAIPPAKPSLVSEGSAKKGEAASETVKPPDQDLVERRRSET